MSRILKFVLVSGVIFLATWLLLPPVAERLLGKSLLLNVSGFSQQVFDRNGELLKVTLSSDDKIRIWTPIQDISPTLIEATLKQEDRYFYWHPGVNLWALLKGAWSSYVQGNKVGASTITMQLARMRFGINSRSVAGKINQVLHAILLECLYSKRTILEAYLNLAPYGGNIEGVGAAALTYFGKNADKLNWTEAISLSVVPQDPNQRIPADKRPEFESAKFNLAQKIQSIDLSSPSKVLENYPASRRSDLPYEAPHFVQSVLTQFPNDLLIPSSLDIGLQHNVERLVGTYVSRNAKLGINNASALLLDARNMQVLAYVGSADFWSTAIKGQNDGVKARRSPGSLLKPMLYGMAMDAGIIHPGSLLKDTEFARASYNPENYEKDFVGPINATDALIRSRNIPAVMLLNQLGPHQFYSFLQRAKVKQLQDENFYGLSMILGGVELRMDEVASLYASLARWGQLAPLSYRKDQEFPIMPTKSEDSYTRLFSPEAARLVIEMLRENPRPLSGFDSTQTRRSLAIPWKTGTSFGFRDAWAAGIVGPYVLVVWLGNFDGQGNPAFVGRDAAGPLFFSLADSLAASVPLREISPPSSLNIRKVKVCAVSGELPGPNCKHTRESWFIPGKSPIHTCDVHREVIVDEENFRVCPATFTTGQKRVVEFWSSDLMNLFRQAKLPRAEPPPFRPECHAESLVGEIPLISSPQANVTYQLEKDRKTISLSAVTDGDSRKTFWFVDDSFVGASDPSESLEWTAHSGDFLVRAVDSLGRANQVSLSVIDQSF